MRQIQFSKCHNIRSLLEIALEIQEGIVKSVAHPYCVRGVSSWSVVNPGNRSMPDVPVWWRSFTEPLRTDYTTRSGRCRICDVAKCPSVAECLCNVTKERYKDVLHIVYPGVSTHHYTVRVWNTGEESILFAGHINDWREGVAAEYQ